MNIFELGFDSARTERMELPGAGRGYRPNRDDENNPKLNEKPNWFEVKFDKRSNRPALHGLPIGEKMMLKDPFVTRNSNRT